ncbi:MAG: hypothetical protein LJE91_06660 [Gammaproteobacteria bacterium]|nr:hypothetical protein [Gammaproteobacteria bacterium]
MLALKIDETRPAYGFQNGPAQHTNPNQLYISSGPLTVAIGTKALVRELADQWRKDTAHQSFLSLRLQHPAYRRILSMGPSVVPFVLDELNRQPDHWFYALAQLTGENPIPTDFTGTVDEAAELWIRWGQRKYAT